MSTTAPTLRPELPTLPRYLEDLPVHRGYPVPWFVAHREGKDPDFRFADARKRPLALADRLCWVCGKPRARTSLAFVIGPMCAVNRISSEPPCHIECAEWSAQACPFLARPHMVRRENDRPEEARCPAGHMLEHNPGLVLVWIAQELKVVPAPGGQLLRLGPPTKVTGYTEGRVATLAEMEAALERGLPKLKAMARGEGAEDELERQVVKARRILGLPVPTPSRGILR